MCGIVGGVSERHISHILLEGLRRLEYRGYDSAGIAVIDSKMLKRARVKGKVSSLEQHLNASPIDGHIGIAHTRWATHGIPNEKNAHPHLSHDTIAVVHNGIIENHQELRAALAKKDISFASDTDTEIVAHLIYDCYQTTHDLLKAVQEAVKQLEGAYSLGVIHVNEPDRLIGVRCGSPLVLGISENEHFIASDHIALLPVTKQFIFLKEHDIVEVNKDHYAIYDGEGQVVEREVRTLEGVYDYSDKGDFQHFMQKEIFEQADAIANTLEGRISDTKVLHGIFGEKANALFPKVEHVQIAACGTSYHAGLIAKHWIEEMAHISCHVEIASELRYRTSVIPKNSLFVCISQSGETADTLAALKQAKELGYLATLTICNVPESSMVREADIAFMTRAGIEVGVASTKAFTTQLTALLLLTLSLAQAHKAPGVVEHIVVEALHRLPEKIKHALALEGPIAALSKAFESTAHTLYLGRGVHYPVAMEGALKLKEISYIHAESYPAGELKHGPLALVDEHMPVIAIAPSDHLLEKLQSNLEEVKSRGGQLFIFTDKATGLHSSPGMHVFEMAEVDPAVSPIMYTIPMQLLAYHVALVKGTDVDQPRNLAKSVTVE